MKVLDLPLKKEWYEMIESGIKREEYREFKPFWMKRIFECNPAKLPCSNICHCEISPFTKPKDFTHVRFRYGYTKRTMTYEIENISIGVGNPNWGAPDCRVIIIKIGKLCDTKK